MTVAMLIELLKELPRSLEVRLVTPSDERPIGGVETAARYDFERQYNRAVCIIYGEGDANGLTE